MIQITSAAQLKNAIANAKAADLLVRPTNIFRLYRVTNRAKGVTYAVNFFVGRGGERFADCTCPAGTPRRDEQGRTLYPAVACKHVAAALALHVCVAARRRRDQTAH